MNFAVPKAAGQSGACIAEWLGVPFLQAAHAEIGARRGDRLR
jgi:hypothetical protein